MWIPFWIDKWIFGSLRIEHTLEERAVWIDLLALAAKDNGYIRANEETPYPIQQLAGMLIIPEEKLCSAIEKFIETNKLEKEKNGTLHVTTWEKYQFTDRYKRMLKQDSSAKTEQSSEKRKPKQIKEKQIITKQIKEKHKTLPDWIPKGEFEEFKKMRMKIRKPMTDYAIKLAVRDLEKLKDEGHDPKAVLEQSIKKSWQGLFPLKDDSKFTKTKQELRLEEQKKQFLSRGEDA